MIERYQLRYFLAVVETGAFSRAAQQVNVTQPTLSAGIAKLERALGGRVFDRNSKRVHLTALGARLIPRARNIEREFNSFETTPKPGRASPPVRLGVLATLPTHLLEAIVISARQGDRGDPLEIVEGNEAQLLSALGRRRIDLALTLVRPDESRFRSEPLRSEGYALAVSATHPLAQEATVDVEALAAETMLVRRSCELLSETSRFFTERGVRPRFSFRTHNDDRAAAMVRAGLGITVVPESWCYPGVALVPLAGFAAKRRLGFLYGEGWSGDDDDSALLGALRRVMRVPKTLTP